MGNLDNLISKTVKSVLNETLEKRVHSISKKIRRGMTEMDEYIPSQEEIDDMMNQPVSMDEEVEVCSECGNEMSEGECSECGYKMEGIYDETSDFPTHQSFDYVEEMDTSDLKKVININIINQVLMMMMKLNMTINQKMMTHQCINLKVKKAKISY